MKIKMTNKEKFLTLVSNAETKTVERTKARSERRKYTRLSKRIALTILVRLDELNWKQKELAEKIGVKPQQVNKWVKGNENFTLETLVLLGEVLGVELIDVVTKSSTNKREDVKVSFSEDYAILNTIKSLKPAITMSDDRVYEHKYESLTA